MNNNIEEVKDDLKAIVFLLEKVALGSGVEEHPFEQDGLFFISEKLKESISKIEGEKYEK